MIRKKNRLYLLLVLFIAIEGCNPTRSDVMNSELSNSCLEPRFTFAYPLAIGKEDEFLQNVAPLPPWEEIAVIPSAQQLDQAEPSEMLDASVTLNFVRKTKSGEEIWILRTIGLSDAQRLGKKSSSLLVYHVEENRWDQYPAAFSDITTDISNLYLTDDGKVWAVSQGPTSVSLFSEEEERFEPLNIGMPPGWVVFDEDRRLFWLFNDRQGIYSINPSDAKIEERVKTPTMSILLPTGVSIAPDGYIYIVSASSKEPRNVLLRFDPDKNIIEEMADRALRDFGVFFSIHVDFSGNLWIENQGWRSQDGNWYKAIPSPVFIGEAVTGVEGSEVKPLTWYTPHVIFESYDGRLWFRAENGIVWLDRETEKWCWITTYGLYDNVSIIEDAAHNLWMIADGKLYKYPLNP